MTQNSPKPASSKKPYIIVGALFLYMCVMAFINRETLTVSHDYLGFFGILGVELAVLCLLFFFLRKREQLKRERLEDLARAEEERKALGIRKEDNG